MDFRQIRPVRGDNHSVRRIHRNVHIIPLALSASRRPEAQSRWGVGTAEVGAHRKLTCLS